MLMLGGPMLMDMLLVALLLGFAAAGSVAVLRALPPIRGWARAGRKPWACDVCSSVWAVANWLAAGVLSGELEEFRLGFRSIACALAAIGICLLVLTWASLGAPPALPGERGS